MPQDKEIREFYNDFSATVLLKDLRYVNPRQEAVKKLCDRFVPERARVLEVGCGIGIISRHLKKRASYLLALDVSDTSISIAQTYAGGACTEFRAADIMQADIKGKFDAIVISDVIEHIPATGHEILLSKLESLLSPDGRLITTFPSPKYQQHLEENKPEALQIIDVKVHPEELISKTSLKLLYMEYQSIFGGNDYVHMVLAPNVNYKPHNTRLSPGERIRRRLRDTCHRISNRSILKQVDNLNRSRGTE